MSNKALLIALNLTLGLILALLYTLGDTLPTARAATYTVTNLNPSGTGSLRQAFLDAEANPGHDTVEFNVTGVITLDQNLPIINEDLTVSGPGRDLLAISGDDTYRLFAIKATAAVTITGLTLCDGLAPNGGAIGSSGQLYLGDARLLDNHTDGSGGGVHVNQGSATLVNTEVLTNFAWEDGGGLYLKTGTVTISGSKIVENDSYYSGGGLYLETGTVTISGSEITDNLASRSGGGLYLETGALTVSGSKIAENDSWSSGGGLYLGQDTTELTDTQVIANYAILSGGGVCLYDGNLQVFGGKIEDNEAQAGGGVSVIEGDAYLQDTQLKNNIANRTTVSGFADGQRAPGKQSTEAAVSGTELNGGGLQVISGSVTLVSTTVEGNEATDLGGGLYIEDGSANLNGVWVVDNLGESGAGVYVVEGSATFTDTHVVHNTAVSGGGGAYVGTLSATLTASAGEFRNNEATVGGGIFVATGTMTLSSGQVISNSADSVGGGLYLARGSATFSDTQVLNNSAYDGAGIGVSSGDLTLNGTQVVSNTAGGFGGGIGNAEGPVRVAGSTFYGNSAFEGGGLWNYEGSVTVTNSTLQDNSARNLAGGILNFEGVVTLSNCTLAGNGAPTAGGILNRQIATLHLKNSILADSTSGGDCTNLGTIDTNTHTLIEDGSCSATLSGDPKLGPLAHNGGGTPTMALLASSPAIDAGDEATCEPTDQRGVARPQGAHCDIGAYEASTGLPVNDLIDPGDGYCNATECTLREAVNSAASGDTVTFDPALGSNAITVSGPPSGNTINLESRIDIDKDLTINGSDVTPNIQVSGQGSVQVFRIVGPVSTTISHLDIVDAKGVQGAAIENPDGTLTVANCSFSGGQAKDGGAIHNSNTLNVSNCSFTNNHATDLGGAIDNNGGTLTIGASTFSGNSTDYMGGAICNIDGTVSAANSTFHNNTAQAYTGGIYNYNGALTLSNSTFSSNGAPDVGAVHNDTNGTLHLKNTILAASPSGSDCANAGTIATNINNLVQDGTCSPDLTGDPKLGPLADNGGDTHTMALQLDSPALDAGDDATCEATDQRGITRPQGDHCDIGAYEREYHRVYLPIVLRNH